MDRFEKIKIKLLRGSRLSQHEVQVLLHHLGYCLIRQKGSHQQWGKKGRAFTLPTHSKEVPFYILDALEKLLEKGSDEK